MKTLVAGIGNIFMGDDGFGCEVIQLLSRRTLPNGIDANDVDVVDFGIRGMDLSYALMEGYELAILVDTVDRGGASGTVYVIEPEIDTSIDSGAIDIDPHGMDPVNVLRLAASLGERRPRLLLVGCQPEYLGDEHGHMGLSDVVITAVDEAVTTVESLLQKHHKDNQVAAHKRQLQESRQLTGGAI